MAGLQMKLIKQVDGSTIIEVLISMVVIMAVFSMALGIFTNVQRLSLSAKKLHAQGVLKEELFSLQKGPLVLKDTKKIDDISVEEEITIYQNNNTLYQISLVAYDANQEKLAQIQEVVYETK